MEATATLKSTPWMGLTNNNNTVSHTRTKKDTSASTQTDSASLHLQAVYAARSDEEIMRGIASGSTAAFEALYDRHVRGCFGLAMKIVRDPAVAEEVVQDVFVKLWSNPAVFSPERGKFSGWLLTLVHNRSVDKLRRAKSGIAGNIMPLELEGENGVSLADVLPDPGLSPDERAWASERGDIVRRALTRLPETQQQAISMAYFGGLTQKEIAEKLNEPLGTIKTRTRSGLQQLRRVLQYEGVWGDLR